MSLAGFIKWEALRFPKDFIFGALYLVSGIYSMGFSFVLAGAAQPVSGRTAFIPVPDSLFPFEVVTFTLFGLIFLAASFYHFRITYQAASMNKPRILRKEI